ncbi:MAG: hypothetical protein ACTS3F_03450 [Phycisphaerales bacterium]
MIARSCCGVAALLHVIGVASAAPLKLPDLFNTGFDAEGAMLEGGGVDAHYSVQLLQVMGRALHEPGDDWIPNSDSSRWIWQKADGLPTGVMRTFRKSFELDEGIDLSMLTITGSWAVAGSGLDVRINGISTGQTASGAAAWSPFVIDDGFAIGTNTIDFVVLSNENIGGFRVDGIAATVDAPGAGSGVAMIGGMLLAGARRRRAA